MDRKVTASPTLSRDKASSIPVAPSSSIRALFASRPTSSSSTIMEAVLAIKGSSFSSSFGLGGALAVAFSFFSCSNALCFLAFLSAALTSASSSKARSSFFLPPFFLGPPATLAFPPGPMAASSAANSSAFSRLFRAASSALAAASASRLCFRVLAPFCQSAASWAASLAASAAFFFSSLAALRALPATALAFGPFFPPAILLIMI